jgi:hypothetical protein
LLFLHVLLLLSLGHRCYSSGCGGSALS